MHLFGLKLRSGLLVIERYYLRGIKRFKNEDEGVPAGAPVVVPTNPRSKDRSQYESHGHQCLYAAGVAHLLATIANAD